METMTLIQGNVVPTHEMSRAMTVYQRVPVHIYLFDGHGDVLVANESAVRHHQGAAADTFKYIECNHDAYVRHGCVIWHLLVWHVRLLDEAFNALRGQYKGQEGVADTPTSLQHAILPQESICHTMHKKIFMKRSQAGHPLTVILTANII